MSPDVLSKPWRWEPHPAWSDLPAIICGEQGNPIFVLLIPLWEGSEAIAKHVIDLHNQALEYNVTK